MQSQEDPPEQVLPAAANDDTHEKVQEDVAKPPITDGQEQAEDATSNSPETHNENMALEAQTVSKDAVKKPTAKILYQIGSTLSTRSRKKRFKIAVRNGETIENALAALNVRISTPAAKENAESTPASVVPREPKQSNQLAIISANMELVPLTLEQMQRIQEAIIDVAIELCTDSDASKPNFLSCTAKSGWLQLNCSNLATVEWMRAKFSQIEIKCGLEVILVEADAFPNSHIFKGCFPQSFALPDARILATISAQNADLSTRAWYVVARRGAPNDCLSMTFVIDDSSKNKLKAMKYKIAYRFGHIRLHSLDRAIAGKLMP